MTLPVRQQISNFLTGTSISGVLRVAPVEDNIVFATFSAETTLVNMVGPVSAGYTKAAERQGDGVSVQLWYKRAGAAESATVTGTTLVSVPLRIHVFECPESLFVVGDPLDEVASNDSSTSAVTTLATGTTATVGQANTLAIAAVVALGGNLDFLLVNWSDDYTALSDHEARGLMVGYKIMTSAAAAAATATWNQASAPTSHKAAAVIATFALAGPVTLPEPSPRRVSFGRIGSELNTTGTVDTVATFPVTADTLYLAFVGTSKDSGNNGDAVIPDSHGGLLDWVLEQSFSIGASRRVHVFRARSASALSAASISVTTPETACNVWWEVLEVTDALTTGISAEGAIAQKATGSMAGATSLETSFAAAPNASNAVVGFCLHGQAERQLIDLTPDVHLLLGEANTYESGGQRATVDWYDGSDQTFRWEWATSIHAISIVVEIQENTAIGGAGYPQVTSITETTFTTNTTDHQVAMPATVIAGELLIIASAFDGGTGITNPAGWTQFENEAFNNHTRLITAKIADGTEGGTTVNVVTAGAEQGAAQVYRITDWWGTLATGLAISTRNGAGGVTTNDVPSLNPPDWGVEFTLWIALLTVGTTTGTQDVTTYPTNYTNGIETDTSSGSNGAMVASARRELAAAWTDPGAFVLSANPAGSATRLIAIRPVAAGGGAQALDGKGTAAAAGNGTLAVARPLAAIGSTATSGNANLAVARPLTATGATAASGSGSLSVARPLDGKGTVASSATGELTLQGQQALDGTGTVASSGSASLTVQVSLTGAGAVAAASTSTLVRNAGLTGQGDTASSGTGTLDRQAGLTGTGTVSAAGTANLVIDILLEGKGTAAAGVAGELSVAAGFFWRRNPVAFERAPVAFTRVRGEDSPPW